MKIINFKVFLISLIAQFTVSFLLQIGLKAPSTLDFLRLPRLVQEGSLTNPLPAKDDLWQVIKTKIEQKKPQPFSVEERKQPDPYYLRQR